jgi:hypothetical protein
MSALQLSSNPLGLPSNGDTRTRTADPVDPPRQPFAATAAAEHLPPAKRPATQRPGAITPRQPLSMLPSARAAPRRPATAVPHPDAAHHVQTQEPPRTRSHTLSAALAINSTVGLDLSERPDTLALPQFPSLTPDLRKPDARALAELKAASRLRSKADSVADQASKPPEEVRG